ncbi:MAG: V-type ATP synthase subunit F [Nitrospirota bacterium]
MKKIIFITPADAEFGFRLTGTEQLISDETGITAALRKTAADPDTGLIIIDERLINSESEGMMKEMERSWHGILLVLPSPERAGAEIEDYASRLIRRAIGYHVRLNI